MNTITLTMVSTFIYTMLFTLLSLTIFKPQLKKHYVLAKASTSFGFLILAIIFGLYSNNISLLKQFLPAFTLCFVGDVSLGYYQTKRNENYFKIGLIAFLLGHIAFVYTISNYFQLDILNLGIPTLGFVLPVIIYLTNLKNMNTGKLKPAIIAYSFFVLLLFVSSLAAYISISTTQTLLLAVGSLLFLISDLILLFFYFYEGQRTLKLNMLNLFTYYYAMLLLALNLLW